MMDKKITILLLSLLALTVVNEAGQFINVENYQYYISHPLKKNWFEALRHCTFECLVLVDIKNEEEYNRILTIIKSAAFVNDPSPQYWTSGTDLGSEGQFFWVSSGQSVIFSDYAPTQPDNGRYRRDGQNKMEENCLEIRGDYGWKWNDHGCQEEKYFICRNLIVDKPVQVANASSGYTYISLIN